MTTPASSTQTATTETTQVVTPAASTLEPTVASETHTHDTTVVPKIYTEAEVQAEADRRARKAIEKRDADAAEVVRQAELAAAIAAGEHEKVAVALAAENEKLKAGMARTQVETSATQVFVQAGLGEFLDILLPKVSKLEDATTVAESFKTTLEARVTAEVTKRLPSSETVPTVTTQHKAVTGDIPTMTYDKSPELEK